MAKSWRTQISKNSKLIKHSSVLTTMFVVFLITFVIALFADENSIASQVESREPDFVSTLYDLPKLNTNTKPRINSEAVVVMDMDSKVVLFEKNADEKLLPASTTKIITSIVVLENYDPNEILTVNIPRALGSKMGLVSGERISVESLLRGLLITSGNDAAEVLAANYPGGRQEFINQMNNLAEDLNLSNTTFTNPSGFDDFNHHSTARDMVRAADAAMKFPLFAEIVTKKRDIVSSEDGKIVHRLESTNELLGEVDGVLGVKTGWTEEAQENLVTFYSKDGRNIMITVLGSQDRFGDTKEIIDWINKNYSWVSVDS